MSWARLQRHAHPLRALVVVAALLAMGALLVEGEGRAAERPLTLPDLLAPLVPGAEVAEGFVLSSPHRGEEHDIQLQARRTRDGATTVVELHVLDRGRWSGIRETEHYGVAWELPRSTATRDESEAVAERLAQVIRRNDVGPGVPVDMLALTRDAPISRAAALLQRVSGVRGWCLGLLLVLVTWALATLPRGAALVSVFLFGLGLALRLPHLDVPFVRDQDVQRVFTGHASLWDIFTGVGLRDRHPPLYFAVLHGAQLFGQSEAVVRMPAVLSGALMGPALVAAAATLGRRVALAAVIALVPTVAFAFVAYSREVSSLPFYALVLVLFATSVAKHHETGARGWRIAVSVSVAVALFTYYTAVFPVLAVLMLLLRLGPPSAGTRRAVLSGCVAGSPALLLAVVTFFRDRGARLAAETQAAVAWGDRGAAGTAAAMADVIYEAVGAAVLVLAVAAGAAALRRRDSAVLVPLVVGFATFLGIAALSPVARVQPYYVMGVVPVLLLALAMTLPPQRKIPCVAFAAFVAGAAVLTLVQKVAAVATLYAPDERATVPAFVDIAMTREERRVAVVASYDMTLLAYYLARASQVEVDYASLVPNGPSIAVQGTDFEIVPLVETHAADDALEAHAREALDAAIASGPCLVLHRPSLGLRAVDARLAQCQRLAEGPESALYRCASDDPPAR